MNRTDHAGNGPKKKLLSRVCKVQSGWLTPQPEKRDHSVLNLEKTDIRKRSKSNSSASPGSLGRKIRDSVRWALDQYRSTNKKSQNQNQSRSRPSWDTPL
jgi:hypothetical protein